jgi:hypothetical protein
MRSHFCGKCERADRQAALESPEAIRQRQAQRAQLAKEKAKAHEIRTRKSAEHNKQRRDLLERLSRMSENERLAWLASRGQQFPPDMIPGDLVPIGADPDTLDRSARAGLIARVGNRRDSRKTLRQRLGD